MTAGSAFARGPVPEQPTAWQRLYWPLLLLVDLLITLVDSSLFAAYAPAHGLPQFVPLAIFTVALPLGWRSAYATRDPKARSLFELSLVLQGAASTLLPVLLFVTLPRSQAGCCVLLVAPLVVGVLCASTLRLGYRLHGADWLKEEGLSWFLHPLRTGSVLLLVVLALSSASHSALQVSLALGLGAVLLGLLQPKLSTLRHHHPRQWPPWVALGVALSGGGVGLFLEQRIPTHERRLFPNPVLYATGDQNSQRIVISRHRTGLEMHVDGRLHKSAFDGDRYVDALAAHFKTGDTALVLSPGSGGIESLLTALGAAEVYSIAPSATLDELSRSNYWLRQQCRSGPAGKRHFEVSEFFPWLRNHPARFDYIVADIPPPLTFREAKFYTTLFLKELQRHLTPGGRAVFPGLSPGTTGRAHQALLRTAKAAKLRPRVDPVRVPSLGDWSLLILGSSSPTLGDAPDTPQTIATFSQLDNPIVFDHFVAEFREPAPSETKPPAN